MTANQRHGINIYNAIISTLVTVGLVIVGFIAKEIYYNGVDNGKKLETLNNTLTEKSVILDNTIKGVTELEDRVSTLETSNQNHEIRLTKLEYNNVKLYK